MELIQEFDEAFFLWAWGHVQGQWSLTNDQHLLVLETLVLDRLTPKLEAAKRSDADTLLVAWVVWA